jgi:hypothetical protein
MPVAADVNSYGIKDVCQLKLPVGAKVSSGKGPVYAQVIRPPRQAHLLQDSVVTL